MKLMLSTVELRMFVYSGLLTGEAQIWQAWEHSQARRLIKKALQHSPEQGLSLIV